MKKIDELASAAVAKGEGLAALKSELARCGIHVSDAEAFTAMGKAKRDPDYRPPERVTRRRNESSVDRVVRKYGPEVARHGFPSHVDEEDEEIIDALGGWGPVLEAYRGQARSPDPRAFDRSRDPVRREVEPREYLSAEDLADMPRPFDFLEGLLYERMVSGFFGPPKAGKSFLVFDLACAVALGRSWAGRECEPRKVLVLPLEGQGTLHDRVRAWELKHNTKCPLIFSPQPLDLRNPDAVDAVVDYVEKESIGLTIIDTLARAMPGADENSAMEAGEVFDAVDRITKAGSHVLLVAHSGKDAAKGQRGSNVFSASPDLVVELSREGEHRRAVVKHNRHGPEGESLRFTLEPVETDIRTRRGKAVHSAVVKLDGDWFEDLGAPEEMEPHEREALAALKRLIDTAALTGGAVTLGYWRDEMKRVGWGPDNASSWRSAWRRTLAALEKRTLVVMENGAVELVR